MDKLFKGFIKCKGKKAIESYKNVDTLKTFEEVQNFDSYAGILAENIILVDIDDKEQSEILMNIVEDLQLDCRVYQTTRGRHFLFKNNNVLNCGTGLNLACGLKADIKIGSKNGIEFLKVDGIERFIEWDIEEGKDYQILPKWLSPVKTNIDFFNMEAGEGRNTSLFTYILTLNNNGFSKEEAREALNIINKYIFKDPLPEEEINTITRDEAFPEEVFFDGKRFLHNNFGDFIKNNNHVKRINGQLHVYKDGVYVEGSRDIENQMIKYIPTMKAQQRIEVLKYLDVVCLSNVETADARYIAFNNGIYDIITNQLIDFTPDLVITNRIPWNYNSNAYSELLDKMLDKLSCKDKSIRAILEEAIGYSFYRRNELSKSFCLTGEGANGKSTYLDLIKDVVGQKNISALNLDELGERFSISYLNGKLVNIADDISDDFWQSKELANFKKIVSGNLIKAEVKNKINSDEDNIKPNVKMFFSANTMPRAKSKGFSALLRRLVKIPFNAKFTKEDPDYDPYISWKLKAPEVIEYAILLGIEGLKRVLENKDFTQSAAVQKELEEYEIENNPILLFFNDVEKNEIENQSTNEVFKKYYGFCMANNFTPMGNIEFSKQVKKYYGFDIIRKSINGVKYRIFAKKEN